MRGGDSTVNHPTAVGSSHDEQLRAGVGATGGVEERGWTADRGGSTTVIPTRGPHRRPERRGSLVLAVLTAAVLLILAALGASSGFFEGLWGGDDEGYTIPVPLPTGPADGEEINEDLITLTWSPNEEADSYCLLITSMDQYGLRLNRSSPLSSYALNQELADGTYRWTVRAVVDGVYGPSSEPSTFTLLTRLSPPRLASPGDGTAYDDALPDLQWSSVHWADDYHLQVSLTTSFTDPVVDVVQEEISFTPGFHPENGTTYYWRAAAHHGGLWSEWSDIRSFHYNVPVAPPTLLAPADEATVLGAAIELNWSDVPGAVRYHLEVGRSYLFEDKVVDVITTDSLYTLSQGLVEDTAYAWRVRAESGSEWSPWSGTGRFFLGMERFPIGLEWTFDARTWSMEASINGTDYYPLHDQVRTYTYQHYVTDQDPTVIAMAAELIGMAIENGHDPAQFILSFVQGLPYTNDESTTGQMEYPRYPLETLVDGGGDCEDKAILYASLMRSSPIGTDAILLKFSSHGLNGHMAVGIAGPGLEGQSYTYEGVTYYYCETTAPGWEIGNFPSMLEEFDVEALPCLPSPPSS